VGMLANAAGAAGDVQRMMVGTPALLADFALGLAVFALTWRLAGRPAAWAALLFFALNPALLFDTVVWIQSDSAYTLVILLSVAMLMQEELAAAWGLAALASLIKPLALSLLPLLLVGPYCLLDLTAQRLEGLRPRGARRGCGGGRRGGTFPIRPIMGLAAQAVSFDRGLPARDLRQCLQPQGAAGRAARAGQRARLRLELY